MSAQRRTIAQPDALTLTFALRFTAAALEPCTTVAELDQLRDDIRLSLGGDLDVIREEATRLTALLGYVA